MSIYHNSKPERPLRIYYHDSSQFVQALAKYKIRRQRWINHNNPKSQLANNSIEIIKAGRLNRQYLDKLFRKKQLNKFTQKRLL